MSDSTSLSDAYDFQLEDWISISMATLAFYEYLITVDQEVSYVWKRKVSIASLLLLTTRYVMVLQTVLALIQPKTLVGCKVDVIIQDIFLIAMGILAAVFSGLRVYALWNGSVVLFVAAFALQLPAIFINIFDMARHSVFQFDPTLGCTEDLTLDESTLIAMERASRIPSMLSDILVVVVTWIKSVQQIQMGRKSGVHLPLSTLLFRDGTFYFLLLFTLGVLELCPNLPETGDLFGNLSLVLPPVLINRFILNLRQLNEHDVPSGGPSWTLSMPVFQISVDVTGNMGESLEFGRTDGFCDDLRRGEGASIEAPMEAE